MYVKEIVELEEVVINIPTELIAQFERTLGNNTHGNERVTYIAAKEYTKHMQPNQIREALKKGYVEMSQINLTICSECLYAEYEAEQTYGGASR